MKESMSAMFERLSLYNPNAKMDPEKWVWIRDRWWDKEIVKEAMGDGD